jgi:endonuclease/exonuclease/phosphatase family metal-dependent hydrolase
MRVATLNLWGRGRDWPRRRVVLAEGFGALAPDLVAFQEAVAREGEDQIADVLGSGWHVAHFSDRADGVEGVSIASRHPLAAVHEVDLNLTPRTAGFPCGTLVAEVEVPAPVGRVVFANHFPSWQPAFEHERELQAVAAARFLEGLVEDDRPHVVVAGDLDAEPAAASVRFWTGRQSLEGMSVCYRDAWERAHSGEPGATFSPEENPLVADPDWPFRQIDHILVRCGRHGGPTLAIEGCERIFDRPVDGVWGSDHFGVMADLAPAASA